MTDDELFSALDRAQQRVKAVGGLRSAPDAIQVAVAVSTAQGIIDNGGLQYFYEADFEDQCPYPEFVHAIGALARLKRQISLRGHGSSSPSKTPTCTNPSAKRGWTRRERTRNMSSMT
jgi:hypothetical protein